MSIRIQGVWHDSPMFSALIMLSFPVPGVSPAVTIMKRSSEIPLRGDHFIAIFIDESDFITIYVTAEAFRVIVRTIIEELSMI
ncbi:hypothetical protein D3C85_1284430 [compost metagenome]